MGKNELDFSPPDRAEHLHRVAETAKILNDHQLIVIAVFISPEAAIRQQVAEIIGRDNFLEIYVKSSLDRCRKHDKTGLYDLAARGQARYVPEVDIPYEEPENPGLSVDMAVESVEAIIESIATNINNYGAKAPKTSKQRIK